MKIATKQLKIPVRPTNCQRRCQWFVGKAAQGSTFIQRTRDRHAHDCRPNYCQYYVGNYVSAKARRVKSCYLMLGSHFFVPLLQSTLYFWRYFQRTIVSVPYSLVKSHLRFRTECSAARLAPFLGFCQLRNVEHSSHVFLLQKTCQLTPNMTLVPSLKPSN